MHVQRPVTQRVRDQLQHARVIKVQRVAGSSDVIIKPPIGFEAIVGRVVDAAKRQGRAELISLAAVVVDDVQNDFDPGVVQSLDGGLEAGDRLSGQKPRIRRKEADRVVAPIIDEPALDQMAVIDRGLDRQELDRSGDPETDEVIDHRR